MPSCARSRHDVEHLADHFGVERARRFVKQQHFRLHGERTRNGDALLLAARKLARLRADIRRHADLIEEHHRALLRLFLLHLQHFCLPDDAVFKNRHVVEQIEALKHHADARAIGRFVDLALRDVLAVKQNAAACGTFQKIDAAKERRFARTGCADDARHVTRADGRSRCRAGRCSCRTSWKDAVPVRSRSCVLLLILLPALALDSGAGRW